MMSTKQFLGLNGSRLQVAIGIIAGLDFLLFGYDQGVTGGLLTLESFVKYFPAIDTTDSHMYGWSAAEKSSQSTRQGITVAAYNLGCFAGSIPTIWIGNRIGRRKAIFLGSFIICIGAILQCTSYGLAQLVVGRLVTGFGNGINTSTVPTWQSECCRSHRRGQMVMIEGAMATCGVTISYWVDFGLMFADPNEVAWRFPISFQIVFAVIILAFVMFLPESPRWLIFKGREDEAREVLKSLLGDDTTEQLVDVEFTNIKATVLEMSKGSFRDMFTMNEDRHFHRTILAYVNQMFQQISGINLITYYIPTLLENQIGLTSTVSRLISACNGTEYFMASVVAIFTIEKFGRRTHMIFGSIGMSLSMVVLAISNRICTSNTGNDIGQKAGIVQTVFLFVFNTFFGIGWLGMTWLYPAEIVPLKIRAPANALSTSSNWIWNFMVVMITPIAFNNIGYKTYVVFAIINAFIVPFVYFFFPETTSRSLEEMDRIFRKTSTVFDVVTVAREEPHAYGPKGELLYTLEYIADNSDITRVDGPHFRDQIANV
ncbi:General substrate transporter [Penicillium pulvis]|uniref:General substrate transporter n=1 Tax=Penicillium pulvis TaxID=1562058 RepID=UPI0025483A4D|nr:General substrate transporter [Penicillium pulvis]KAJ5797797.1 General substrate transporter [Penicillium pulvis]